ncbi:MAG: sortase [Actinomycetota bacterium]
MIIQQILNKPKGYVATDKGAAASLSYLKASAPMKISIPSIGMTTSIIKLGLDSSGALQVPTTGAVAGWYTGSPTPGELGPSIIVAHVDMGGKLGVFFHLKDLKIGAKIDVLREDGKTAIFEVTQKAIYLKSKFPTTKIYGNIDFADFD